MRPLLGNLVYLTKVKKPRNLLITQRKLYRAATTA